MYQLAVAIIYSLAYLAVLELWPAVLHFHHADINPSLPLELSVRGTVLPFLVGALLSTVCKRQPRLPTIAFAVAPAVTFLLNGILLEAAFSWWEVVICVVAGACSVAGAWTAVSLSGKFGFSPRHDSSVGT